jgi:hypothetical protein
VVRSAVLLVPFLLRMSGRIGDFCLIATDGSLCKFTTDDPALEALLLVVVVVLISLTA